MRLWYLCILFMCFWCITVLIEDSKRVKYVLIENTTEGGHFELGCMNLKWLKLNNETGIDLDQLRSRVYKHLDLLNDHLKFHRPELFEELFLKQINLRKYYIFKDFFCVVIENKGELFYFSHLFETFYSFNQDTYDHSKPFDFYEPEHQLIVLDRWRLQQNCREHYSKAKCLNECIKGKQRLAKYLYSGNESGLVLLNYDGGSESVKANERECINRCKGVSCKLVYYIPNKYDRAATVFEVHPLISRIGFYVQLFGLMGFFTNLSLCKLLSKLVKFSTSKEPRLSNHRAHLELAVPFICLLLCSALYAQMVLNHVHRTFHPLKKEITMNSFKIEQIDLIICAPVQNIVENSFHKILLIEGYLLRPNSFSELEKRTEAGLNQTLENIWMAYQNRWTNVSWNVKAGEVLFRHERRVLYRCFRVEIDYPPAEAKYRELLSITKMVVKMRHGWFKIYLLPKGQSFSEKSLLFVGGYGIMKCVVERTKLSDKCVNYGKNEVDDERGGEPTGCDSQDACISLCINREFMNNFQSFSPHSHVIDKKHFTAEEWNRSHPCHTDFRMYLEVKKKCREKYWNKDCTEIFYRERNALYNWHLIREHLREVELYFDVVTRSRETPSAQKLLFNMINIQSLLLNLTALRMLGYIQGKLNYKRGKLLILLICSAGFLSHIYHVISGIVQVQLVYSQHFDLLEIVRMPETILCFEIEFDETEDLTGELLQQRTRDLTLESVFKQIAYLDNRSNWVVSNASELRNSKLNPEVFYFINLKCFMLRQEVRYSKNQFEFREDREVLKVYFNETIFQTSRKVFFMSRIPNTLQLSKITRLESSQELTFTVSQEIYLVRFEDEFNWLRNPFSLFSENDVDKYIANLASSFRTQRNATTLYLPLEEENFGYAINDTLFEIFYTETERSYNAKTANTNYKRLFAINNLNMKHRTADMPNFVFTVIFFRKTVVITSEHSFLGLVLNVLNCFILWYSMVIPNFPIYIKTFWFKLNSSVKHLKTICLVLFEMLVSTKNLLASFLRVVINFLKSLK